MPVFRCTMDQIFRGQTLQNVIHVSTGGAAMTQVQVADAMADAWVNSIRFIQVNELNYVSLKVQQLGAGIGPPFVKAMNVLGSQGASSSTLTFSAFVIKCTAFAPGRKAFGRAFIGGHVGGAFVNGIIEIGQQNFWNNTVLPNLRSKLMGLTPSSGLNWGLITNKDPSTFRSVEEIQIRSIAGAQRRRNIGTGI